MVKIRLPNNLVGATILLSVVIGVIYGWVANIVSLAGSSFDPLTGMVVLRVIGIFVAPLGIVLGYV